MIIKKVEMMPVLEIQEIQKILPHRYPFLLVDRVLDYQISDDVKSITAIKNVSINESFFNGHFPGDPVMPGVLILESMAQAAGILGFKILGEEKAMKTNYYFAGAEKVRFKKAVKPGDQLVLKAKYVKHKCGIWTYECESYVDEILACKSFVTCAEVKRGVVE
jgi:3-hydroxyacyl-[acyl-carrier-protein] dehydratase